jgi:hypothetical protein
MALKDLSTKTMLEITGGWLDADDGVRGLLEGLDELKGALHWLDRVHAKLGVAASTSAGADVKVRDLTVELREVDQLHDRKVRGLFHTLTGLAELTDDAEEAHELVRLRGLLFPLGMSVTLLSYEDQAREVRAAQARLDEQARDALDAIVIGDRVLTDAVDAWVATGARLEELSAERAEAREEDPGVDILEARRSWVGAVEVVAGTLRALELEDEVRAALLGPLEEAEATAATRRTFV